MSKLDYKANAIAKGTYPGSAKYIFSKDDWEKYKEAVKALMLELIGEDDTANETDGVRQAVQAGYNLAKKHMREMVELL